MRASPTTTGAYFVDWLTAKVLIQRVDDLTGGAGRIRVSR